MRTEPSWLHPEAINEARAAREWYLVRNAEAADAFMAELDAAVERIEHRFPFFVVFREAATRVEIVAVAHARRRPGYWLGR